MSSMLFISVPVLCFDVRFIKRVNDVFVAVWELHHVAVRHPLMPLRELVHPSQHLVHLGRPAFVSGALRRRGCEAEAAYLCARNIVQKQKCTLTNREGRDVVGFREGKRKKIIRRDIKHGKFYIKLRVRV